MNENLKDVIKTMFRKRIIGAKHSPEEKLLQSKIRYSNKNEQKIFYEEYKTLLQKKYFIRLKKRTGRGSEYHISLNPEMFEEIHNIMRNEDEI